MNKPASELIAMADNELLAYCRDDASRWASAFVAIKEAQGWGSNDIDNDLMICWFANAIEGAAAYRTAANQSGSERAGVDAQSATYKVAWDAFAEATMQPETSTFDCLKRAVDAALATAPAQPAPAATHGKPDGAVREALRNLLDYAEQRECSHEATHRGGSIWTICDECGKKWADDRGGFIPYQEPKEITQARAALHSPKIAAADDDVETCIACNIAFVEGDMVYPDASGGSIHASCCGPERESYANADGEPLKDGDPMPTPQRWTSAAAETSPGDVRTESSKQYRDAVDSVNRSTDREIADALAMKEALARAFCVAKGVNPNCLHQNYDDEPVDHTDAHGRTFHFGWRNQLHLVDAALPFIDRLDVKAEAKSQEAEAVTIKPLEWYEEPLRNHKNPAWNATTDFGSNYRVFKAWRGKEKKAGWIGNGEFHNTEAEAKAAAQSDYEQRIRSALIHPTTKPEAPAVGVDALEVVKLFMTRMDSNGEWDDGCFYYNRYSASELQEPIRRAAALIAGGR